MRLIEDARLYEISLVLEPANPECIIEVINDR